MSQIARNDLRAFLIFFFEIFGNYRKSSEVFGLLRKFSENFDIVAKFLKQSSSIRNFFFFTSSEIVVSLRKSSNVFRKKLENVGKFSNRSSDIFVKFRKFSEMLGIARKTSETLRKFSNMIGGLRNFQKHSNLLHLWTEDQVQEF